MFAIQVTDYRKGDGYVMAFGKKSPRARSINLRIATELSCAMLFGTRIEADAMMQRINNTFIDASFELDVIEMGA